jgi:outer membrane protein TolC
MWRTFVVVTFVAASCTVCRAAEPVRLSFEEAIRLALLPAGQARLQLAAEADQVAQLRVQQARSLTALQLDAGISDRVLRFDLRSIGVDIPEVSPFVANVNFPEVVGPFTVLDTRIRATKSIVNRSAARQLEAAKESAESTKGQSKVVAAQIAAETARAYLNASRARSEADFAAENVKLFESNVSLANERRTQGLVTGAEVRRANLDLAEARQKVFAAESAFRRSVLQLVAVMGIPLDTQLVLTDGPTYRKETPTLEQSLQTALQSRPELAVSNLQVQALRLNEQAIAAQSLPSLGVFGDFGILTVAPTPTGDTAIVATPSYTAGFEMRLPILDGHRRASQRAEIDSQIRQATIRQKDARRQLEAQVRLAIETLESTARQIELAEQQVTLAEADVTETRGRHDAGEASGIELSESQARALRARHDYILAVYQHDGARIALAEATGSITEVKW